MEREIGAQVAPPIFLHQQLPRRFCEPPVMTKKRDLSWQNPNFQHQQQLQFQHQQLLLKSGFQNPNWNPKVWDWDSVMFVAKPSAESDVLRLGTTEEKKKGEETLKPLVLRKENPGEDGENLTLKLGGSGYLADEPAVRASKRVRSGSPGGGNYPMCQVDDCKGNLSNAKDYHRRHKVCEHHSKTAKALVGKQMQRFCQQCSRFHPLSEFDEGKRSCRRRLAGHNRRRRKTQPEDASSRLLLQGNQENSGCGNLDIVNLLTLLARLQGNDVDKDTNGPLIPDRERLIQILSKINSLPVSANSSAKLPVPGRFDLNIAHPLQASSEKPSKMDRSPSVPSTADLLAIFSAAFAACSPDALAILSQGSSDSSGDDKTKINCLDQADAFNLQKKPTPAFPPARAERSVEVLECPVQEGRSNLPLHLFSSSPEDDTHLQLGSSRKYFSSDSSNPMEERSSPSSSPPVVQKLFPLNSATEISKHDRISICGEDNVTVETSTSPGWISRMDLFKGSNGRAESGVVSNLRYQAGYTSSSGSDHSPSSSNSDAQDRTGRIIFKLFDKDPSNFPGTLRTQILNWLSNSPSEMESYIRPGCVVLSIYLSMPSFAWEELQEGLLERVSSLVQDSDSDFWRVGRFLVQTDKQLASHKDGRIRLCKSWGSWRSPELISVSPLAVVGGEETALVLRGRNLSIPCTKIHCTFMGGYMSKEVAVASYSGTIYDDSSSESFHFTGGAPNVLGRCFIEVENGFKGNSFPLIIADASICRELRILESELEEEARMVDVFSEDQNQDFVRPRSREDVLHFLNELGWLFQRKCIRSSLAGADFSLTRFKFLFTFSVERDWVALVKTLLDILVERSSGSNGLSSESLETLSEVHLLNRAVKRKCRKMIDLLLHYSVSCNISASKKYLFPPNLTGPGGVTPLHLAACTENSEEMVDALTNDPQEIGLNCWSSLLDENGLSSYMYASVRHNHSYNRLVARKLSDRRNNQLSITVSSDEILVKAKEGKKNSQPLACARCVAMTRCSKRIPGAQGLLYRPYLRPMLTIAAVCVCVCLFLRGLPDLGSIAPFKWENVDYGWC
ncbi:squamosa promoter-binding-like protein 14 [Tasmannia lanceolata]|uniref:squamosa promoter-binding-like protein 14 n=1 Tax=Tasmannia lanceolata TaxID=3420 RepID=UPI004063B30E